MITSNNFLSNSLLLLKRNYPTTVDNKPFFFHPPHSFIAESIELDNRITLLKG